MMHCYFYLAVTAVLLSLPSTILGAPAPAPLPSAPTRTQEPAGVTASAPRGDDPRFAALRANLTGAVGDAFTLVRRETGIANKSPNSHWSELPFYFASLRANETGRFQLQFETHYPHPFDAGTDSQQVGARFDMTFKVDPKGSPRVLEPAGERGATYAQLVVGDTVIVPIYLNPANGEYHFSKLVKCGEKTVFLGEETLNDTYWRVNTGHAPTVKNNAVDVLQMRNSLGGGAMNEPGTRGYKLTRGYFEFIKVADFDFEGAGDQEPAQEVTRASFHVVGKDQPVTVLLDRFAATELLTSTTSPKKDFEYTAMGHITPGTLEVRVGDHVLLGCGGYESLPRSDPAKEILGGAAAKPFQHVAPYVAAEWKGDIGPTAGVPKLPE